MTHEEATRLTDEQLLEEAKKLKPTTLYDSLIIGVLIGIALYSTVKNSFGFMTFIPALYIPIATANKSEIKVLNEVLKERNLQG